jgi:serine protease Do
MKTRLWPAVVVTCACLALVFAGIGGSDARAGKEKTKDKKPVVKPVEIQGELTDNDPKDKEIGGPAKVHKIKLKQGTPYLIDLTSTDFDSFLRLLDADGAELGHDDDGGEGFNSRLRFSPKSSGEFQLVATSYDKKPGKYLLRIQSMDINAKAVAVGDEPVAVIDQLGEGDAKNALGGLQNRCKIYRADLKAGAKYVLDLESTDFDAFLILQDGAGNVLASDDDSGGNLNSRIRFACPTSGNYVIIATGLGNPLGEFQLKIRKE